MSNRFGNLFEMKELNNVKLRVSRLFPAFKERMQLMEKITLISGKSQRTFDNYSMYLAIFVEKVQKMPEDASDEEIDDFLFQVLKNHPSNSQSSIRTHVYALRYYFRLFGMSDRSAKLPKLVIRPKLPVVLSEEEVRRILISIKNDMHRIMLATMYSLGMRISELMNLKWENIFFDRRQVYVTQAKGAKERVIPMGEVLFLALTNLYKVRESDYVFHSAISKGKITQRNVRYVIDKGMKAAGIERKGISPHVFRHSYATHLLDMGLDIITLKRLLGHSKIVNTELYLHVAQVNPSAAFSPLDVLLGKRKRRKSI